MDQIKEILPHTWLVQLARFEDLRGAFVKTLSKSMLDKMGCKFNLLEEYYSISKKDVIRGMHFQMPPHDHVKIVYCIAGSALDVVLDLRPGSTHGKFCSVTLDSSLPSLLIIPKGVAHGFRSLTDGCLMVYKTSSEYADEHDAGILWNSFDFDWGLSKPILSKRDRTHCAFKDFQTPFPRL